MLKRTISGAVLVIILVAALVEGHYFLWALLLLTSLAGVREFLQAVHSTGSKVGEGRFDILALTAYGAVIVNYICIFMGGGYNYLFLLLLCELLVMMLIYVVNYPGYEPVDIMAAFFSAIYIGIMLSVIYILRRQDSGIYYVWFVFIGSWICDTCAYFAGSALGKHKLAPKLSPKKSVEGSVGGCLGSFMVGLIYGALMQKLQGQAIEVYVVLASGIVALVTSVFSQVGDLMASAIKRHYDIKDYGSLIPGHGGILDRFDSVIVTAPLIYILVILMGI